METDILIPEIKEKETTKPATESKSKDTDKKIKSKK